MGLAVIAPFTEEELESMRAYDRRCSDQGDYRMDFIEKCIDDRARIAYRPDAAAKIHAMGMSLACVCNSVWHGTIYGREANQSGLCDG